LYVVWPAGRLDHEKGKATQNLRVKRNGELMDGEKNWLSSQPATSYDAEIVKLRSRYDKCLTSERDYVEK
jgi:hypothetical protein